MTGDSNCTTAPGKLAIIYGRFSPKPEFRESLDSIEVQEEACRKYCDMACLSAAVTLRDPFVSARQVPLFERPEGSKIPHLIAGGIKDIVCVRLDRMFRATIDGIQTLNEWQSQGVSLHLANQGGCSLNGGTATGRLLIRMLLSIAEFEPDMTSERTAASMKSKQRRGQRMTSTATLPWGWVIDPNSANNERGNKSGMLPNYTERNQTLRLRAFLNGDRSLSEVARIMNESGSLCRGKPWDHAKVKRAANAKWEE